MLDARVIGFGHSTVRHHSLKGVRLALCEGLDEGGRGNGRVFLAADWHGAGVGQRVFVTTDGEAASRRTGAEDTPLRNVVLGIAEDVEEAS
ncbi:MAG: EutN/CcmL family microcompartment protein [Puniceicoccaceae bacterium]